MSGYTIDIGGRNETSAGVRALHVLRDELEGRGFEAAMSYDRIVPGSTAVYPEIQGGAPLGTEKVARWLLGAAPMLPDDGPQFQWGGGMDPRNSPVLCVDLLEEFWAPDWGLNRTGVGFWIGRGEANFDLFCRSMSTEGMTEMPTARNGFGSRVAIAEWMAGLDYFVSFDPYTAVITEAINVGTPVVVLADPTDPRLKIGMGNEWNKYGVAWAPHLLDHARETVQFAAAHYRDVCCPQFQEQIDVFVEQTQADWA